MKCSKLSIAILLLACSNAIAQGSPIASIRVSDHGETKIKIGEIVKLEARSTETPGATYLFRWKLVNPPGGYEIEKYTEDDGRRVYFASGIRGAYQFQLVVVSVIDKKINLDWLEHTVYVGGSTDPPDVPDEPDDPVEPDDPADPDEPNDPHPPDPTFGMSAKTQSLANQVNSPDRADTAKKLAANYVGVAGQIASGQITQPSQAKLALVTANRRSLTAEEREAWTPFAVGLSKELDALEKADKFKTINDYRIVLLEIGDGLLRVK